MLSKEEIEFNLKALSGVMLNFEDRLCDEMQERVKEVKDYIDNLESDKQKITEKLLELEFKKSSCVNMTEVGDIYEEFVQELEKILKFKDFLK